MNTWAVEALAIATQAFQGGDGICVVHERSHDTRGAQSSSNGGVGGVEPEEDRSLAECPSTTRVCCSATTQRDDAANAELCTDRSGRWLRRDQ
jgi:hypothetical protein